MELQRREHEKALRNQRLVEEQKQIEAEIRR
jgi:hypothetical protein